MNDHAPSSKKTAQGISTTKQNKKYSPPGSQQCCNCGEGTLSRKRTFSVQAWTVLLVWNEINPASVDQPICDVCYEEMRSILMDRTEDIEDTLRDREAEVLKVKKMLAEETPT
jgi:hypothetical protein